MQHKEAITFSEFETEFKKVGYKYVGLFAMDSTPIVSYNGTKTPLEKKLQEIKLRLESKALGNGYYIVKCKNQAANKGTHDEYIIRKGEASSMPNEGYYINNNSAAGPSPQILTYESARSLENRINELEYEKRYLEEKMERLKEENEDLKVDKEELESDNKLMADKSAEPSAMKIIKELTETAFPILEEHFEIKRQENDLEASRILTERQKLGLQNGAAQQQQHPPQPQPLPQPGNPNGMPQQVKFEDLTEEQFLQYSEQQQAQIWHDYLARFAQADPEGYQKFMAEQQQQRQQQSNG